MRLLEREPPEASESYEGSTNNIEVTKPLRNSYSVKRSLPHYNNYEEEAKEFYNDYNSKYDFGSVKGRYLSSTLKHVITPSSTPSYYSSFNLPETIKSKYSFSEVPSSAYRPPTSYYKEKERVGERFLVSKMFNAA